MTLDLTQQQRRDLMATMKAIRAGATLSEQEQQILNQYYNATYYEWLMEKDLDNEDMTAFEMLYFDTFADLDASVGVGDEPDPGCVRVKQRKRRGNTPVVRVSLSTLQRMAETEKKKRKQEVVTLIVLLLIFGVALCITSAIMRNS